MSILTIKIIACITMVLDHIKYAIPATNCFATEYLGRIAYPLFAFFITEGYVHTKNLKKYFCRLLIFALISQIPFMLFRTLVGEYKLLNILFTLLLGLLAITSYEKIKNAFLSIIAVCSCILLGAILKVDYGWFGVATVFLFYLFRKNKIALVLSFAFLVFAYYLQRGIFVSIDTITIESVYSYIATLISLVFICAYNGQLGYKTKYVFYWFYPVHMLLLYGLHVMIF